MLVPAVAGRSGRHVGEWIRNGCNPGQEGRLCKKNAVYIRVAGLDFGGYE